MISSQRDCHFQLQLPLFQTIPLSCVNRKKNGQHIQTRNICLHLPNQHIVYHLQRASMLSKSKLMLVSSGRHALWYWSQHVNIVGQLGFGRRTDWIEMETIATVPKMDVWNFLYGTFTAPRPRNHYDDIVATNTVTFMRIRRFRSKVLNFMANTRDLTGNF